MSTPTRIQRFDGKDYQTQDIKVVDECAVAIEYNGISHAVMMATPTDLEDFALGFSLSEGIVESSEQVYGMDLTESAHGWTVQIEIAGAAFDKIKQRRRQMTGRSGCGLCGTESLAHAIRPVRHVQAVMPSTDAVTKASNSLKPNQIQAKDTGAMHAAAGATWTAP